ncbi:uncharacterized protein LOC109793940 isoform X2 [Cajanus cajan]|nr:uncharacterized protein LOC109793940 isoform X2 [Cajanus cajan]
METNRIKDAYLKKLVSETSIIGHDKWRNQVFEYFRFDCSTVGVGVLDRLNCVPAGMCSRRGRALPPLCLGFCGSWSLEECIPDAGRGGNAIPVPQLSSPVLSQVTAFFNMKHDYTKSVNTAIESLTSNINATIEHIKALGNDYHAAVTNFVQANISNFPSLQQAADYLDIPTLARFTSMALGFGFGDNNMKEKSVQDISNWYAGISKLGMLSPLLSTFTKQIHSIISHLDFFA